MCRSQQSGGVELSGRGSGPRARQKRSYTFVGRDGGSNATQSETETEGSSSDEEMYSGETAAAAST